MTFEPTTPAAGSDGLTPFTARFTLGQPPFAGQPFVVTFRLCGNPCCPCGVVGFECRTAATPDLPPQCFDPDLFKRELTTPTPTHSTPDGAALGRAFLAEAQEPEWVWQCEFVLTTKRRRMATMDLDTPKTAARAAFIVEAARQSGLKLAHLLQSVAALARPRRIPVPGSSSLLPLHPKLGGSGQPLQLSLDADLLGEPIADSMAAVLKDAVRHESAFEQREGYSADILRPTTAEALPAAWESRLQPVAGCDNGFALDLCDLALVKLVLGRAKDLDLLRALLKPGILDPARLRQHDQDTPLREKEAVTAGRNLTFFLRETDTP